MHATKPVEPPANDHGARVNETFKMGVQWLVLGGASLILVLFVVGSFQTMRTVESRAWLVKISEDHFAAAVGIPFAAVMSLVLVMLLEFTAGEIQVRGFGFEFKGAGGPLVMWIFCFLAMASAIKMLW